jgi:hypothetical protein
MTQLEEAMRSAGVELPTSKERVWNAIKESMPTGISTPQLVKRLKALPPQTVYTAVYQLNARSMVYRTLGVTKGFKKGESVYFTDMDKFQLLPMPGVIAKRPVQKAMSLSIPELERTPKTPPVQISKFIDIDHLTIAEAKDLWRRLSKLFAN